MIAKIRSKSISFSIILTFLLTAFWVATTVFIQELSQHLGILTLLFINSTVNIAITIFAVILLGVINHTDGFKHLFKTKGITKGLFVLIPAVPFFLFGIIVNASGTISKDIENVWIIPLVSFFAMTMAFMQTALFRGLLATALFMKFSSTEKERIKSVFKASALFLVFYLIRHIFIGNHIEFTQLVNTFIMGAVFCAAYLYSKNLMSLVIFKGFGKYFFQF